MTSIKRIHHIALVVGDIEAALAFWSDCLGLEVSQVEDVPEQDAIVAILPTGDADVELVKPTNEESGIARFLQKHGPGMHHICFEVDNLNALIQKFEDKQVRMINPNPIIGTGGKRIMFIHPESTHGVLVELYELSERKSEIRIEKAQKLANRARIRGQVIAAGIGGFLRALRQDNNGTNPDDGYASGPAGKGGNL